MSERTSEHSGGRERSEQSGASERVSGASERTSEWPSTYVSILVCSRPQEEEAEEEEDVAEKEEEEEEVLKTHTQSVP